MNLTPVQERMLEVLGNGKPHHRDELLACLRNSTSTYQNLNNHISILRKKLNRRGEHIVCELVSRRICYRWVRLISIR